MEWVRPPASGHDNEAAAHDVSVQHIPMPSNPLPEYLWGSNSEVNRTSEGRNACFAQCGAVNLSLALGEVYSGHILALYW